MMLTYDENALFEEFRRHLEMTKKGLVEGSIIAQEGSYHLCVNLLSARVEAVSKHIQIVPIAPAYNDSASIGGISS